MFSFTFKILLCSVQAKAVEHGSPLATHTRTVVYIVRCFSGVILNAEM